jgi:hypothetical protein
VVIGVDELVVVPAELDVLDEDDDELAGAERCCAVVVRAVAGIWA